MITTLHPIGLRQEPGQVCLVLVRVVLAPIPPQWLRVVLVVSRRLMDLEVCMVAAAVLLTTTQALMVSLVVVVL